MTAGQRIVVERVGMELFQLWENWFRHFGVIVERESTFIPDLQRTPCVKFRFTFKTRDKMKYTKEWILTPIEANAYCDNVSTMHSLAQRQVVYFIMELAQMVVTQ